jgi:hypothetical protein
MESGRLIGMQGGRGRETKRQGVQSKYRQGIVPLRGWYGSSKHMPTFIYITSDCVIPGTAVPTFAGLPKFSGVRRFTAVTTDKYLQNFPYKLF